MVPSNAIPMMSEERVAVPRTMLRSRGHTKNQDSMTAVPVDSAARVKETPNPPSATSAAFRLGSTQLTPKSPVIAPRNHSITPSAGLVGRSSSVRIASSISGSGSRSASRARNTARARSRFPNHGRSAVIRSDDATSSSEVSAPLKRVKGRVGISRRHSQLGVGSVFGDEQALKGIKV